MWHLPKAGSRVLFYFDLDYHLWGILYLLFLQLSVLDFSLCMCSGFFFVHFVHLFIFPISENESPFSPSKPSSHSTLLKAKSLKKPFWLCFPCRSYLSIAPKHFLNPCSLNFRELCKAFSELSGPSIILTS